MFSLANADDDVDTTIDNENNQTTMTLMNDDDLATPSFKQAEADGRFDIDVKMQCLDRISQFQRNHNMNDNDDDNNDEQVDDNDERFVDNDVRFDDKDGHRSASLRQAAGHPSPPEDEGRGEGGERERESRMGQESPEREREAKQRAAFNTHGEGSR